MELILTRGIPASGKTTWARQYVAEHSDTVNLNRDDFRAMMFGPDYKFTRAREHAVTFAQTGAADELLSMGKSVIISDTNLNTGYYERWRNLAKEHGADFRFEDFECDLDVALERNDKRANGVPASVIHRMHRQYVEIVHPDWLVEPNPDLPPAIIVDVDGTLADSDGVRSPYDMDKVGEDKPHEEIIKIVQNHGLSEDYRVIVMTGRDGSAREATAEWLYQHRVLYDELHTRAEGDTRKDSIVKRELFDEHVRDRYDVRLVIDDRLQVIYMWRSLGLKVLDVAGGTF